MVDLSSQATIKYWKEQEDSSLFKIIASIEDVETWTLDGDTEIEEYLNILGESLDNLYLFDISELKISGDIIKVLSNIKLGRMLRIMQLLDENNPGIATKLLMEAEENISDDNDHYSIFLSRNLIFERLRLSSRVFSEERFKKVIAVLESDTE